MKRNITICVLIISLINCFGCVYYFNIPIRRMQAVLFQNFTGKIYPPDNFVKFIQIITEQPLTKSQSSFQKNTLPMSNFINETKSNLVIPAKDLLNPNLIDIFKNFSISFKDLNVGPKVPMDNNQIRFEKFVLNLTSAIEKGKTTYKPKPVPRPTIHSPSYINPHPYNFTVNNVHVCSGNSSSHLIMIVVCTALNNSEARMAIRETWGSPSELSRWNARLVFLMGATLDQELQKHLQEESEKYQDIIQENFLDTYRNLTLKSIALLKWVRDYCPSSKYVLKADDDMFINLKILKAAFLKIKQKRFVTGCVIVGAKPIQTKTSKWYTALSDFSKRYYPRYLSGTAYAMSTDLVAELYNVTLHTKFFWLEDVYITGVCAGKLGVHYIPNKSFTFFHRPATGCAFLRQISGHQVSVKEMHKIWNEIQSPRHCQ